MSTVELRHPAFTPRRWRRVWLGVLVVAWGIQAIVTQSLLLREALVLMFGSELAWGVVLFAWLLGVAAGAAVGGWAAERLPRAELGLVAVLLTLSAAACVELWVFRGARAWLGVEPGELLPLTKTVFAAMLFVSPASALVGMAFPLACCVVNPQTDRSTGPFRSAQGGPPNPAPDEAESAEDRAAPPTIEQHAARPLLQFGHVYALESAGSLIGGALFSFWAVEHLAPIQTALLCGAVTAAASAGLLLVAPVQSANKPDGSPTKSSGPPRPRTKTWQRRLPIATAALAVAATAAALLAILAGDALNRRLVERRWQNIAPGYELVAEAESKYQNLAVGRLTEQYSLYCDGQVAADFPDPYTFAPLAHFWLCQHPAPSHVLLLGGGAEGLLAEMLHHPIERIDYVEVDPRQIELVWPYLAETDRQALADPRVTVHHVDARYYVKTQRDRFDLVVARLPEPTSASRARFYTEEFYGELRRAMTRRSVLCLTAAAAPGELSPTSRAYLASVRATLQTHFQHVVVGWGNPAHVLAATDAELTATDPAELTQRYLRCGVDSALFHPAWFDGATDWLDPDKLAYRRADLDGAKNAPISTDLRPSVYIQRLVLWEAATSGGVGPGRSVGGVIRWLRSLRLGDVLLALALAGAIPLAIERLRRGPRNGWASGIVVLSVGTTGFATMALSIVWLFAFQNLYGYVYQRIGWIIALFMAGLVIGCLLAERGARRGRKRALSFSGGGAPPRDPSAQEDDGRGFEQSPERKRGVIPDEQGGIRGERKESQRERPEIHDDRGDIQGKCGDPSLALRARWGIEERSSIYCWRWLILVDLLLALLALASPFLLPALGALQTGPATFALVEWCVSIMVVLTGILGGAVFPLAAHLQLGFTGRTGAAAASVDAADHAGACFGALLCGILLVPIFGTATTAFLLAGMKVTSAALLIVGRRFAEAR